MSLSLDASFESRLDTAARDAEQLESQGYAGLWTAEHAVTPFFPLLLAAGATTRPILGTGIAVAFPRSPFVLAQYAWELQQATVGRFVLGLGSQIRSHNERRLSVAFDPPGPRMRELIRAVRAIWRAARGEEELAFRGEYYTHDLMPRPFTPLPPDHGDPPIYLAAVGPFMFRLAGQEADGVFIHPFHTPHYLETVAWTSLDKGLATSGRQRPDLTMISRVMILPTDDADELRDAEDLARERLAFYGSTTAYHAVLEAHGWHDVGPALSALVSQRRWDEMPKLISDEILEAFTVRGRWAEIPDLLRHRYDGILDRVIVYDGFNPRDPEVERQFAHAMNER